MQRNPPQKMISKTQREGFANMHDGDEPELRRVKPTMSDAHPNALLARLRPSLLDEVLSDARQVPLQVGQVLAETGGLVLQIYFPHAGALANLVDLSGGKEIISHVMGRDGVFGAGNALDDKLALNRVSVLAGGTATVLAVSRVVVLAQKFDEFRKLLVSYEQFNSAQAQQTAACNASHSVEARCCRWLLQMHDLAGPDLNLTQDMIARMLGVRRTSITEIAGELAALGAISYSRGRLKILDTDKLKERTCECSEAISQSYKRLCAS